MVSLPIVSLSSESTLNNFNVLLKTKLIITPLGELEEKNGKFVKGTNFNKK
jgi:hypothetical protein